MRIRVLDAPEPSVEFVRVQEASVEFQIVDLLENLASIKWALSRKVPDWEIALQLWIDRLHYSRIGVFRRIEPVAYQREKKIRVAAEVEIEAEDLRKAL